MHVYECVCFAWVVWSLSTICWSHCLSAVFALFSSVCLSRLSLPLCWFAFSLHSSILFTGNLSSRKYQNSNFVLHIILLPFSIEEYYLMVTDICYCKERGKRKQKIKAVTADDGIQPQEFKSGNYWNVRILKKKVFWRLGTKEKGFLVMPLRTK